MLMYTEHNSLMSYTVKPVLRGHIRNKEIVAL